MSFLCFPDLVQEGFLSDEPRADTGEACNLGYRDGAARTFHGLKGCQNRTSFVIAVLMVLTGGSVAVVGSWLPGGGGYGFVAVVRTIQVVTAS